MPYKCTYFKWRLWFSSFEIVDARGVSHWNVQYIKQSIDAKECDIMILYQIFHDVATSHSRGIFIL